MPPSFHRRVAVLSFVGLLLGALPLEAADTRSTPQQRRPNQRLNGRRVRFVPPLPQLQRLVGKGEPLLIVGPNHAGEKLAGANLSGRKLRFADLRGADLRGANLSGADLEGAQLKGANLQGARLRNVNLRGASLGGALLTGADLTGARLRSALYDARTTWPGGFDPVRHGAQRFDRT